MARWPWLILLLMVVVSAVVRWGPATSEFGRNADGTGAMFGIAGRNYVERGWQSRHTFWMPVISVGDSATVYAHHPPTVPLLIGLAMRVVGGDAEAGGGGGHPELGVRLQAYLCTLALMVCVFGLMRERPGGGGVLGALFAAGVIGFVPMTLRYGQMPDVVNSQLVLTAAMLLWSYLRWLDSRGSLWVWLAALVLAMLTDWPGFYWVVVLAAHLLLARPAGYFRALCWTLGLGVGVFALLYAWSSLASGDWGLILRQFLNRSAQSQSDSWHAYTAAEWWSRVLSWNLELFGLIPWCLGLAGLALALRGKGHWKQGRPLVFLPAAWAVLHVVVGRQAVWMHQWWWWPVALALAVSGGSTLGLIAQWLNRTYPPLRAAAYSIVLLLLAGLWTAWTLHELRHLRSDTWRLGEITAYSPKELGAAVRAAAPKGRAVMIFEKDEQPYLYFYANRPLIQKVWDAPSFEDALHRKTADLFYTFRESIAQPPAALVIPRVYEPKAGLVMPLLTENHAAPKEAGKFLIYRLQ